MVQIAVDYFASINQRRTQLQGRRSMETDQQTMDDKLPDWEYL